LIDNFQAVIYSPDIIVNLEGKLGAQFLCNDQFRVVEIEGRKFCEGMLEATLNVINDDAFEERGKERCNPHRRSGVSQTGQLSQRFGTYH
jgi:hypothetical protein